MFEFESGEALGANGYIFNLRSEGLYINKLQITLINLLYYQDMIAWQSITRHAHGGTRTFIGSYHITTRNYIEGGKINCFNSNMDMAHTEGNFVIRRNRGVCRVIITALVKDFLHPCRGFQE